MNLKLGLILSCCLTSGCAIVEIKNEVRERAAKETVTAVYHQTAPSVQTPGTVLAAEFTFYIADSARDAKVDKPLPNPSKLMRDKLVKELKLKNVNFHDKVISGDGQEQLATVGKNGLVLQILPASWSIIYLMADWSHYQMYFSFLARLTDTKDNKVLWNVSCSAPQDGNGKPPTIKQLEENNAELLRKWIEKASSECVAQFVQKWNGTLK